MRVWIVTVCLDAEDENDGDDEDDSNDDDDDVNDDGDGHVTCLLQPSDLVVALTSRNSHFLPASHRFPRSHLSFFFFFDRVPPAPSRIWVKWPGGGGDETC